MDGEPSTGATPSVRRGGRRAQHDGVNTASSLPRPARGPVAREATRRRSFGALALIVAAVAGALAGPSGASAAVEAPGALPAPSAASATTGAPWRHPVDGPWIVTRAFDLASPYEAGHRGVDVEAGPGLAVHAPADGVVRFAGVVVDRPVLSIEHAGGLVSSFEPVEPLVARGDAVTAGQLVARVSAEHRHDPSGSLHIGARVDGVYVDPLALLGEIPRAVLLPLG